MLKVQKFIPAVLGILLIVFGCNILFDSLSISPRLWLLPVIGIGLLVLGIKAKNKVLRDIGVVCLILGVAVIVNALFIHPMYSRVFYLAAVAIAIFCVSAFRKNGWLCLLGVFAVLISGTMLIDMLNLSEALKTAYTLILIATALVVLFIVENDKLGFSPLIVGILFYLMSLPRFLMHAGYVDQKIAQVISAALLIVSGVLLVIFVYKKAAKENESE